MSLCIEKHYVELTPRREDHIADVDLLRRALPKGVRVPLDVLRLGSRVIREADYRVTAAITHTAEGDVLSGIEAGNTEDRIYGLAIDLGSTTVAGRLIELRSGREVAEDLWRNHQRDAGDDILSRIFYCKDDAEHTDELRRKTVASINELAAALCGAANIPMTAINCCALAGNTTMIHFLLGLDTFCVFHTPFLPRVEKVGWLGCRDLGFDFGGMIYIFPSAANYMGGDITSGVLATGVNKGDDISLFIDIGTNGEMVIGSKEFLVAGAGAAGPALEGDICKTGMRAKPGAVDTVTIDGDSITCTTIANAAPAGICGSGIVDLMAQMLLNGWIDRAGSLNIGKNDRLRVIDGENCVVYAENEAGEPLVFTQTDIDKYTESKAAAHTMVVTLLEAAGLELNAVKHIYLAGAFGTHMALESAISIGIYPDIDRSIFIPSGNTSLKGACGLLKGDFGEEDADRLAESFYYLEFAMQENFVMNMQEARFYPHTNIDHYPTVKAKLGL